MKRLIKFDCLFAIVTIPVAVFLIIVMYKAPRPEILQKVPAHSWPIGLLSLFIVSVILLFIQSLYEKRKFVPSADLSATARDIQWYKKAEMSVVLTILGLLSYALFLRPLGFIICTSLLVIYQARVLQRGRWVRNIVSAITFSITIYFALKMLMIQLPAGLLNW